MFKHGCQHLSRQLVSVLGVTILLACAVMVGLVRPPSAAADTATAGWIRQFGTSDNDSAKGVSAVAGAIYVGEHIDYTYYPSPPDLIRRYDASGNYVSGLPVYDSALESAPYLEATCACSTGIYAVGYGYWMWSGDYAEVLKKYQADGTQAWSVDGLYFGEWQTTKAVFADSSSIYTVGYAERGGFANFVAKWNASGSMVWEREISSGPPYYDPSSVSAYSGNVYVGGVVEGSGAGFVRKYDSAGNELWTRWAGFAPPLQINAVSADSSGVYVAGTAHDASEANGRQAFVRKYDSDGNTVWTRDFGSSQYDYANAIFVNSSGVYVAGATGGTLPGQTSKGGADAFVRKYDASGNEAWTYQFGSSADDAATSISADATGIYVAGDTDGAMPGQTSSGGWDAFVMQIATPITAPTLLSPANGAYTNDTTPSLDWSTVTDASPVHYQVQVANNSGFSSPVVNKTWVTSSSYTIPTALANGTYYWRVRAVDAAGNVSAWTSARIFRVDTVAPPKPTLVSPANWAHTHDTTPFLDWSTVTDPSLVHYQLQVARNASFSSPVVNKTWVNSSSYTVPTALADGTYYWRVRSVDAAGNVSAWTSSRAFLVP